MRVRDLCKYRNVIIQCHDVPDADTIASGFALQHYLRSNGKNAKLVYGGRAGISKPNLLLMLKIMGIELEHISELPECDLLVTVDCQYGAGNVQKFEAPEFMVIDHHKTEIEEGKHTCIRPSLGSCSTLVWDLLRAEDYKIDDYQNLCDALYYGLFTDTNGFAEINHPLDRDMADILPADSMLIKRLKNSAITLDELDIVGTALSEPKLIGGIGLFKAKPCDPNILGFTSDIAQQVEQVDCSIVYCELPQGLKLSIRSSVREVMANEIAAFLCRNVGSGGGNIEKAGGFMKKDLIKELPLDNYLEKRIDEYNHNFDFIYCGKTKVDFTSMAKFKKLPLPVGFAKTADIFPCGTPLIIRTLEGDVDTVADDDIYVMVGIYGEVYSIKKSRFTSSYVLKDQPYTPTTEYFPTVTNRITGERKEIASFTKCCVPSGEKIIYAEQVQRDTKVFSFWDKEKYFFGSKGDYLACNIDDTNDCYIIRNDIFHTTYTACDS